MELKSNLEYIYASKMKVRVVPLKKRLLFVGRNPLRNKVKLSFHPFRFLVLIVLKKYKPFNICTKNNT